MSAPRGLDHDLIKKLDEQGLSHSQIAETMDCARSSVSYVLDKTYREKAIKRIKNNKRENKLQAVKYKGGKCEACGYNKCIDALEFHHLDESTKNQTSGMFNEFIRGGALNRFRKAELDKCQLLCANCHREAHHDHG